MLSSRTSPAPSCEIEFQIDLLNLALAGAAERQVEELKKLRDAEDLLRKH